MTSVIDIYDVREELVFTLRNADILSTSERNVTTYTDTGTFSADSTHTVGNSPTQLKNVRSITVAGSPLSFSDDYTYVTNTGVITFTSPQTGAYSIQYDSGTDKIFSDFPKTNLSVSSFPRIAVDVIGMNTVTSDVGANTNMTELSLTINVYSPSTKDIDTYITSIKTHFIQNKKTFSYLDFVEIRGVGNLREFIPGQQKIFMRNIDYYAPFNLEEA